MLKTNKMLKVLIEDNLISPKQTGFKPGDSCISYLISITNEICDSLDPVEFLDLIFTWERLFRYPKSL